MASKSNPQVAFIDDSSFKHIMSRLVLKIEVPFSNLDDLSAVKLAGLCRYGTFDVDVFKVSFQRATDQMEEWEWDIVDYEHKDVLGDDVSTRTYTLIFPPQSATYWNGNDRPALSISITFNGKTYTNDTGITGDVVTTDDAFLAGKSYEYTIQLKNQDIEVGDATIADWTSGSSIEAIG